MEEPSGLRCELCLKPQSSATGLKQHVRRIHKKVSLVPIQCGSCEKILRDEHTYKVHLKAVHGTKHLACPVNGCQKSFSQAGILNAHMKTHSEDRTYICSLCGLKFKDKCYYQKHLNYHKTGKKPFECELCGKTYIQLSHLKDHMTLHTGISRFKCETCGKTFRQQKTLKEHIYSHTGQRPHKCSSCSYSTQYRKSLLVHQKKHSSAAVAASAGLQCLADYEAPTAAAEEKSPIFILVNLPDDKTVDKVSIPAVTVSPDPPPPVYTSPDTPILPTSPLSLLLSAAASESGPATDPPASPLDLSLTSAQLSQNPDNHILEFTSVNSGRRRSVFLVEELDYEHQGEMTVVDPAKVTGLNQEI